MNKWELVPYTRGKVLQPEGEPVFPHFKKEIEGELDALVGLGDDSRIKKGGFWCRGEIILKRCEDGSFEEVKEVRPTKSCVIARLGAWGDLMQMTSILPGLKQQGYHITLHCSPRGFPVVKNDPRIDAFVLQDPDQVPNVQLTEYFLWLKERVDLFINLSESVEGTLLAMPGRPVSFWNKEARHAVCDINYVELTHKLAGLPYQRPQTEFVSTREERDDCRTFFQKHGGSPNILWVLSGSAVHKTYPHLDSIIARVLLTWPQARIFTVGEELCEMLEEPWVNESRVIRMSGVMEIRPTMVLAQACDLVIGPETGVMSAVSMMDMGKVLFLSHSTVENLSRDWINTQSLYSKKTPCYPCHMMIFGWDQCVQAEESGAAQCQEDIEPDRVWAAVQKGLQRFHIRMAA
jgi:ADP-heptose:LPS heptosyltransferase